MILTVTLNPALDLTYEVDELRVHATNRVTTVRRRPGGKGVNVAAVLRRLDEAVEATGLAGGAIGEMLRAGLAREGIGDSFVRVSGETRCTVAVVDGKDATVFNERGPDVSADEWQAFVAHLRDRARSADVVVVSGSLPQGVPDDAYRVTAEAARHAGVPVIVDAEGPALLQALAAQPAVIKPNLDELRRSTGVAGAHEGARLLLDAGARCVAVSRGPQGLLVVTDEATWEAPAPWHVAGNPTGAGDAAVAAIARGLVRGSGWDSVIADAVALSAAAVASPHAGDFDAETYRQVRAAVGVTRVA